MQSSGEVTRMDRILAKGTLNGSLVGANAGPLEFDVDQNGLKAWGAIALSMMHR
jgi:hypothetical protein